MPLLRPEKSMIYLTGFMGTGKSTVGPLVAEALGYGFFDLDECIEQRLGKSIAQIFHDEGERFFRAVESEILRELATQRFAVIALGGGTIVSASNLELVKATGMLICLGAEPAEIFRRVAGSDKRPLLEGSRRDAPIPPTDEQIYQRIEWLLSLRAPYYAEADVYIETTGKSLEAVVQEVVNQIERLTSKP